MQLISLSAIANQSFTVQLDSNIYEMTLNEINGLMAATLTINGTVVISGTRLVPETPILPYRYQENGNFILFTEEDEYPYYTEFGVTQYLLYLSQAEIEALND